MTSRIHVTVVLFKQFWKRVSANSVSSKKRLPICPEHLHALVQRFAEVNASLSDIRDVCLCLVSFAGFLRFSEACNIRWCDIDFKDTYSSLHIPRSKTDQYGSESTRIGGASAAANNDLPDHVIKKHGRWKSEKAKDTCCSEDIQHQLLVTLNIGI